LIKELVYFGRKSLAEQNETVHQLGGGAQTWWQDYQCNMNLFMNVMILDMQMNQHAQGGDNSPEHSKSVRPEYCT